MRKDRMSAKEERGCPKSIVAINTLGRQIMRMTEDADKQIFESALPDSGEGLDGNSFSVLQTSLRNTDDVFVRRSKEAIGLVEK